MGNQAARIRWNSFFAFLSQLIRMVTNFLLFVGIARFYGPEAFGQFTTAHTLSTIFLLFADFGFETLLITELARARENALSIVEQYFGWKIVFAIFSALVMILMSFFTPFSSETRLFIEIFSLYVLFTSATTVLFALFKGIEQFQYETKISLATNATLLCALVGLGIFHAPLWLVASVFIGTRLLGFGAAYRIALRLLGVRFLAFRLEGWREIWPRVISFGMYIIFGNLYFFIDTILLALWRTDVEVGIYQAALKIILLIFVIPDIGINTMTPVLSRLHQNDRASWISAGRLFNKTLFLISLPLSMILFVYPENVIKLVYGSGAFVEAVPILRIFAFTVFVRFGVEAYALMLTTSRRQTTRTLITVLATGINVALNFIVIPAYGYRGAAYVSLLTNLVVGAGYVIATRDLFVRWAFDFRTIIPFIIVVVLCLILWNLQAISFWYGGTLVVAACGAVMYLIGFSKEEWKLIFAREKGLMPT